MRELNICNIPLSESEEYDIWWILSMYSLLRVSLYLLFFFLTVNNVQIVILKDWHDCKEREVATLWVWELLPGFSSAPRGLECSQGFGVVPRILECSPDFGLKKGSATPFLHDLCSDISREDKS